MAREGREQADTLRSRARQREQERGTGGRGVVLPAGVGYYEAKNAKSTADNTSKVSYLDIIPYRVSVQGLPHAKPGQIWYERTFKYHYFGKRYFNCPGSKLGKDTRCPVCEYVDGLRKQPRTPEIEKLINDNYAKTKQLFNVIDLDDPNKRIQVMNVSFGNFGKQLKKELEEQGGDRHPEIYAFADPLEGFTLKIRWDSEKGANNTTYWKAGRIDFLKRENPYKESIADQAVDLDTVLVFASYEEMDQAFNGVTDEDPHAEPEATPQRREEPPARRQEEPEDRLFDRDREAREDRRRQGAEPTRREDPPARRDPEPEADKKCPGRGKFGEDLNKLDECEQCSVWGDCNDAFRNTMTARRDRR